MAVTIYYDDDADLGVLEGKKIAIIGYGIQGGAQSLCLRDSGLDVIVSELPGTPNHDRAVADGWEVYDDAAKAAAEADLIQILTQDHVQKMVYEKLIKPNLEAGNSLIFSHGFNIHYKQIIPPDNVDVFMVAPKGPGALVRECYISDTGVPSLLAVYQDYTGKAKDYGLAYAKAIKATKAGLIETTFAEETITDLFGEQVVLCGGVTELITAAFDTLVANDYAPEMAYFEVLHELKLIMDLVYNRGIIGMRRGVSDTATYGDLTRGPRIITEETRAEMQDILREIENGSFAKEWILENQAGRPMYNALLEESADHLVEQVGAELRAMMPWINPE
jgi:ketol-acid reductoisomerase